MSQRRERILRTFRSRVAASSPDWWLALPVLAAVGAELYFLLEITLDRGRPPMTADAGIFQHAGWYLTRGARLYVDIWDIKLPLSYETTGLLALLSGGDMYVLHLLSVLLTMAAAVGVVGLVAVLVRDVTHDPFAAAIAGGSMLLLSGYAVRPAYGFKPKYLVLLFGLLAIYLQTRDHPALAGAAAAASVGYWQGALAFPCLVVGMAIRRGDRRSVGRTVAGGVAFTALMLLPVFTLWQSSSEMVVQTVLVPVTTGDSVPLGERIVAGVAHFKWATPLVLLGGVGVFRLAMGVLFDRNDPAGRDEWWMLAGAVWFVSLLLFVDFEVSGYSDLIPSLAFLSMCLGVVAARLSRPRPRAVLAGAVTCLVVVNVALLGSFGLVFPAVETPGPVPMSELDTNERTADVSGLETLPDVRYLYWHEVKPTTCHYRLSLNEVQWLERMNGITDRRCVDLETAMDALNGGASRP